jgi:hypothetical protein
VDALSRRNAIVIEEGDNCLCRWPNCNGKRKTTRLPHEIGREVLERRNMLEARCERCAVIDAFPQALLSRQPSIRVAIARAAVYVEAPLAGEPFKAYQQMGLAAPEK